MHTKIINVAIAEGDSFLSVLLKFYFETHPEFSFTEHLRSHEDLMNYSKWDSSIVLLSFGTLGLNGVSKLKDLIKKNPHAKVLCYTNYADQELEKRLINIGVKGLFTLEETPESIFTKIKIAEMDGVCIRIDRVNKSGNELFYSNRWKQELFKPKEQEIIRLLSQGKSNRDISSLLGLSFRSVQSYVARIKEKTNCRTEKELIVLSFEKGWNI